MAPQGQDMRQAPVLGPARDGFGRHSEDLGCLTGADVDVVRKTVVCGVHPVSPAFLIGRPDRIVRGRNSQE